MNVPCSQREYDQVIADLYAAGAGLQQLETALRGLRTSARETSH